MWKFHDFSVTQILREINFEESRSFKTAFITISGAMNFGEFGKIRPSISEKMHKIKIQGL